MNKLETLMFNEFDFIEKCLNSCKTPGQIDVIEKMVENFEKKFLEISGSSSLVVILIRKINTRIS